MVLKAHITAVAIAALSATSSIADVNSGSVRNPIASAPIASSAWGEFTESWNSGLGLPSTVEASLFNAAVTFSSFNLGAMKVLSTSLNGNSRTGSTATASNSFQTIATQVIADGTTLSAGSFDLGVAGSAMSHGRDAYADNIPTPHIPESRTLGMLLASLGLMGTIALRRIKANTD